MACFAMASPLESGRYLSRKRVKRRSVIWRKTRTILSRSCQFRMGSACAYSRFTRGADMSALSMMPKVERALRELVEAVEFDSGPDDLAAKVTQARDVLGELERERWA